MQGLYDATLVILQILRDLALGGIVSLCALVSILLTFLRKRCSKITQPQETQSSKRNQARAPFPSNKTRFFLRDGYHRALLVKDLDVIDSTNLNRYLVPNKKNLKHVAFLSHDFHIVHVSL